MADTHRLRSALVTLLANNTSKSITAQRVRDWLLSSLLRNYPAPLTSATPTLSDDDVFVALDGTNNTVTVALPDPATSAHRVLFIKAVNVANAVTLTGTIDGGSGYTFTTAMDAVILACNGTTWHIFGEFLNV